MSRTAKSTLVLLAAVAPLLVNLATTIPGIIGNVAFWTGAIIMASVLPLMAVRPARFAPQVTLLLIVANAVLTKNLFAATGYYAIDPWYEWVVVNHIATTGELPVDQVPLYLQNVVNFPFLHLLTSQASHLTGLEVRALSRYVPLGVSAVTLLLFALLVERLSRLTLTREEPCQESWVAANVGAYALSLTYGFFMFHSLFIREVLAVFFAFGVLYALLVSRYRLRWGVLTAALSTAVIFTHHLTALILGLVFGVALILHRWVGGRTHWLSWLSVLFVAGMLGYWFNLKQSPILLLQSSLVDFSQGSLDIAVPQAYGGGRLLLALLGLGTMSIAWASFAAWGAGAAILRHGPERGWAATYAVVGLGLGGISLALLFGGSPAIGPQRFELFGYYFLLVAGAIGTAAVLRRAAPGRQGTVIVLVLLAAWGTLNLSRIPPVVYATDPSIVAPAPDRQWLLTSEEVLLSRLSELTAPGQDVAGEWQLVRIYRALATSLPSQGSSTSTSSAERPRAPSVTVARGREMSTSPQRSIQDEGPRVTQGASKTYDVGYAWAQVATKLRDVPAP